MRRIHVFVLALLLASALPAGAQSPPAPAASPGRPDGWWGAVGGGVSAIRFACQDCGDDMPVYESPSMAVSIGKTIGRKVAFGVELNVAFPALETGTRVAASALAGMARWYPAQSPFYVKFSVGLSRVRASLATEDGTDSAIRNGTGIAFGAGYDIRVGRAVALTPYAGWYMSAIGDIGDPSGTNYRRDVSWNTWTFGLGVTIF